MRLALHSLHSSWAVAPEVMPLPMPQVAREPRSATVRIGTLKVAAMPPAPSGRTTPMAPQYTPRGVGSSAWMSRIALGLGAPVTEPQGNSAPNTSASRVPARVRAATSEVICHTVGRACA